eukprot:scaffold82476_cov33-Prasinocladus_malaysianus.AAC.1
MKEKTSMHNKVLTAIEAICTADKFIAGINTIKIESMHTHCLLGGYSQEPKVCQSAPAVRQRPSEPIRKQVSAWAAHQLA